MESKPETLPGGTVLFTGGGHAITTDSLLLARFCDVHRRWAVCDLGSGCGVLLLSLMDREPVARAVAVEQDADAIALLQMAKEENGLAQLQVVQADLKDYRSEALFDLVVANPPYFDAGKRPATRQRALARHELACDIADVAQAAARILKDGGRFCLCWPPARLQSLFAALAAARLAPKRMQLVRKQADQPPWLVLLDARKAGGEGLALLPDLLLPAGETLRF